MEALWTSFFSKLFTECGLVGAVGYILAIAAGWLLNRRTSAWEKDRATIEKMAQEERGRFLKLVAETNEAMLDLSVAVEKANAVNSAISAMRRQA